MEILDWIVAHKEEILCAIGAVYALVSIIVGLTPGTADDRVLRRVAEAVSFLPPSGQAAGADHGHEFKIELSGEEE